MRKLVIRLVGGSFILIALFVLGDFPLSSLFTPGVSYNLFLLVMGVLAFAAANLGGQASEWFDFILGILLVVLCLTSAGAWYYGRTEAHLGTILFYGVAGIGTLYFGYLIPANLKKAKNKLS